MKQMKKRDRKIDNLRACAIIVVVLGHSIILYSRNWGIYQSNQVCEFFDYVKEIINLIQMPLFFSISGYLFAKSIKAESFPTFMVKKAKRLIIPFLFIGLTYMIPLKMFLHYPGYHGTSYFGAIKRLLNGSDMGHLWFLPTLFLYFAVSFWVKKFAGSSKAVWASITVFASILTLVPSKSGPYVNYLYHFLGYYWSFVFGALISSINLQKVQYRWKMCIAGASVTLSALVILMDYSVLALIASASLTLCCYLFVSDDNNTMLARISKNSFGIYLLHSPLIYITFTYMLNANPIVVFIVNFFIFGSLAFLLSECLSKTQVKYLIGQWS